MAEGRTQVPPGTLPGLGRACVYLQWVEDILYDRGSKSNESQSYNLSLMPLLPTNSVLSVSY